MVISTAFGGIELWQRRPGGGWIVEREAGIIFYGKGCWDGGPLRYHRVLLERVKCDWHAY